MSIRKAVLPSSSAELNVDSRAIDYRPVWPRVVPFVAYMSFIAIGSVLAWLGGTPTGSGIELFSFDLWLYPIKTLVVGALLLYFWVRLDELRGPVIANFGEGLLAVAIGLVVYFLWVRMNWAWATQGEIGGYNPFQAGGTAGLLLAGIRIFGASVVVPIMEELFWRSFLIRFIIQPRFAAVRLGTFTLSSFLLTIVLFGLEHNLWLAGMMAGAAYNLLLYRTGRLWPCIIAHGVTNFVLGLHVLTTAEWHWW